MEPFPFERAVIVGVGLIGGSLALALRERRIAQQIVGLTRSEATAAKLRGLGIVGEVAMHPEVAFENADLVVVCSPVSVTAAGVVDALRRCGDAALVTDAASTKRSIVDEVTAAEPNGSARFVPAHPLAGDHRSGPDYARADLFEGAVTVVTPTPETDPGALERVAAMWTALGSRVETLSPAEHDARLARTSHLPHVVAAALASATPAHDLSLAATGWADTTRVASGSAALWRDILLANGPATADAIRRLGAELDAFAAAIEAADGPAIERLLEQGKARRDALGS